MEPRIRIKLKSFDPHILDKSARKIALTARATGAKVSGPIPLPTQRKLISVIRSPHVHKRSQEQFEQKIHKRLLEIWNPSQDTIEKLSKLALPPGVEIEVKAL